MRKGSALEQLQRIFLTARLVMVALRSASSAVGGWSMPFLTSEALMIVAAICHAALLCASTNSFWMRSIPLSDFCPCSLTRPFANVPGLPGKFMIVPMEDHSLESPNITFSQAIRQVILPSCRLPARIFIPVLIS
jgi:hypothetical protein